MVAELKVDIQSQEVRAGFDRLRRALPLGGDMTRPMTSIGRVLKTAAQMRFRSTSGPDGREWLQSRRAREEGGQTLSLSRRLRNSLTYAATRDSVAVGTNVVYAAIHQFGGIIRAKSGPFLAIPITAAARAAGSPRNMQGLAIAQSLKGQFMLVDSKTGTVHFLLRRQVTMPARPFLGVSSGDESSVLRVLQDHLEGAWRRN